MQMEEEVEGLSYLEKSKIEKKQLHIPFDVESWYPQISEFTFHTEILELSRETALSIVKFYRKKYIFRNSEKITIEDINNLEDLEKQIDAILSSDDFKDTGAFVRLSSRSPKDGLPVDVSSLLEDYETLLQSYSSQGYEDSVNTKMIAFTRSMGPSLRSRTGREAMNLIVTSERVYSDILLALDCFDIESKVDSEDEHDGKKEVNWDTRIFIRKWDDRVRDDYEFRGFVYQGKLTALSQYNHYCVFPYLMEQKDMLCSLMFDFFDTVKDKILLENYIIDFCVLFKEGDEEMEVMVVELNPFERSTGSCLFCWRQDKDILEGREEFEFRIYGKDVNTDGMEGMLEQCLAEMEKQKSSEMYWVLLEQLKKEINEENNSENEPENKRNCALC